MDSSNSAVLTIRYLNGTEKKYEITTSERDDLATMGSRLRDALDARHLTLDLDDRLLIIPFENVQEIELTPVPPRLPGYVVKNVTSLD